MQPEHQEHLGRPAPEALHGHEPADDLLVRQRLELPEIEAAVVDAGAEVAKIADLLPAQPDAAKRRVALGVDGWRTQRFAFRKQRQEPGEDGRRRLGRELLTDDGAYERGQMIVPLTAGHPARSNALDRDGQNRIAPHQHAPRFFVTLRREARGREARTRFRAAKAACRAEAGSRFGRAQAGHFIDAVSVTSASSSMSPGSTVVTSPVSPAIDL